MPTTKTPGQFGRPENPDHYLNDDLKPDGERQRRCWSIDDENAVDTIRAEGEKLWQTSDLEQVAKTHKNIERAVARLIVANEIGRRTNIIWCAEQEFENKQSRRAQQNTVPEGGMERVLYFRRLAQRARVVALSGNKTHFQQILAEAHDLSLITLSVIHEDQHGVKSDITSESQLDEVEKQLDAQTRKKILETIVMSAMKETDRVQK